MRFAPEDSSALVSWVSSSVSPRWHYIRTKHHHASRPFGSWSHIFATRQGGGAHGYRDQFPRHVRGSIGFANGPAKPLPTTRLTLYPQSIGLGGQPCFTDARSASSRSRSCCGCLRRCCRL